MNSLNPPAIKHNIKDFPKAKDLLFMQFGNGNFGQYIEFNKKLKAWKEDPRTKRVWISQKRKSATQAFKEFRLDYNAGEYYASFGKHDDSIEVFYREKGNV